VKELHDLETYEVSLVPKGANGKKFLVFKNLKGAQGMKDAKALLEWVAKNVDPAKMKEVQEVIKGLAHGDDGDKMPNGEAVAMSDKAKAALQAIARIASPMKDEIHPMHLMKVMQAAGYDMQKAMDVFGNADGDVHHPDGEPPHSLHESDEPLEKDHMKAIPEDVLSDMKDVLKSKLSKGTGEADAYSDVGKPDELEKAIKDHMGQAEEEACKAYKSHLEKLGYRKYPDLQPRFKSVAKDLPKQVDVSEENHERGEAQPMDKNVMKSLDLSKVDPKVKTALEAVFKGQQEAIAKAAKLEGELKAEREARRSKEFIEKAAKLNVGGKTEDVAMILKTLADSSPEQASKLEALLAGAGEQIKKGELFKELGTERGGGLPGNDAWAKIEEIAKGMVEKSADKMSKADAIDAVLKTAEGKRLYDEYNASRPGMKVS
jgi:hypothetical protein